MVLLLVFLHCLLVLNKICLKSYESLILLMGLLVLFSHHFLELRLLLLLLLGFKCTGYTALTSGNSSTILFIALNIPLIGSPKFSLSYVLLLVLIDYLLPSLILDVCNLLLQLFVMHLLQYFLLHICFLLFFFLLIIMIFTVFCWCKMHVC